jgi:membrane protease YdiL (CAAX protease family)
VFVPGDATKALGATAVALGLLFAVALGAVRFAKARAGYDLYGVILVAGALPQVARGAAVVVISACEELVFRAAIARSLESKLGSSRAIWAASGLYVLAQVGSLHPSLIVAALLLSLTTTYLVARERRVLPAMMAHAAFSWLALEMITPAIWQRLGG